MTTHEETLTIAIIGGGFGGTYALKELERLKNSLHQPLEVLLFEPRTSFVFTPLLHEVATAGLDPAHVTIPFDRLFDDKPWIKHVQARVTKVDLRTHTLTAANKQYHYDHVLFATGSVTNFYGNKEAERHALPLKDETDAERLRFALERALLAAAQSHNEQRQRELLSIAIVGGGPTGVELSAEIRQFLHHRIKKTYRMIRPDAATVTLLQGAPVLLPAASPRLQDAAWRALLRAGVTVHLAARVISLRRHTLVYEQKGASIILPANITVWVAGVTPQLVPGVATSRAYLVNPDLSLIEDPDAFAVGDAAAYDPGTFLKPVPALAQAAVQEGTFVAQNILRRSRGEETAPFLFRSKGFLLSLGQRYAIGEVETPLGTLYLKGFLMWWLWRTIYLYKFLDVKQRRQSIVEWTRRLIIQRSPAPSKKTLT